MALLAILTNYSANIEFGTKTHMGFDAQSGKMPVRDFRSINQVIPKSTFAD